MYKSIIDLQLSAVQKLKSIEVSTPGIDWYGMSIQLRLQRELDIVRSSGIANEYVAFINKTQGDVLNINNSLVLWLFEKTSKFPIGEFTPIQNVKTDRLIPIDIDIDISSKRRGDVIDFIKSKMQAYPIVAYNTLSEKSAIKELGRAHKFPFTLTNSITKSLDDLEGNKVLSVFKARNPTFFEEAEELQGSINHVSTHASGIAVFDGEPEDHYIALRKAPKGTELITDIDGEMLGKIGVMKVDLLGSSTTDIIFEAEQLAGTKLPPDEELIEDPMTIDGFHRVDVGGIFQAEGGTNKMVFNRVRPTNFLEVVDCISLARPGTKDWLPAYVNYKDTFESSEINDLLEDTRGTILYQEQVLKISQAIGGLTGTQAENLRSAITKKKMSKEIDKLTEIFLSNAKCVVGDEAEKLWETISAHVTYSFNKSHAVAYALQSFREMYLKMHHPLEFWCSMLNNCKEDEREIYRYEIAKDGIEILLPGIENTCTSVTIENGKLRLPVTFIKGLGDSVEIDDLCFYKEGNIHDVIKGLNCVSKKNAEALILTGFFDSIEPDRNKVLEMFELKGQISLFAEFEPKKPINVYEVEKENFGFWVTEHPVIPRGDAIVDVLQFEGDTIVGLVEEVSMTKNKKGDDMMFISISDSSYMAKCIAFSQTIHKMEKIPIVGDIVCARGEFNLGSSLIYNLEIL